jgi:hypothetical protein
MEGFSKFGSKRLCGEAKTNGLLFVQMLGMWEMLQLAATNVDSGAFSSSRSFCWLPRHSTHQAVGAWDADWS